MEAPADPSTYLRHLMPNLREALADTPAVLVNGPRQCGKTTLVRQFTGEMPYYTLDDPTLLAAVRQDPLGFVRYLDRAIIDGVQRAPECLLALKLVIDQDRRPGRFLLTGSANLMALPRVADSLAGRMAVHTLLPLSQAELQRRAPDFLARAQAQDWSQLPQLPQLPQPTDPGPADDGDPRVSAVLAGGYPEMRQRVTPARRQAWARAYVQALVERDVRDVAQIDHLHQIPPLLAIAATHGGQLFNASQIGGQLGLDTKTVDKYLGILEKLFLVQRLPAWNRNELSRLVKTPKLHFLDAGLQATLTRLTAELVVTQRSRWGATLETWVHGELRKALSLQTDPWFLSYYRDKDQVEVDFMLESPERQVIGIEVKAAASVSAADFKGLRKLQQLTGDDFLSGLVLYDGPQAIPFGDRLWAVPLAAV
jgi:uncharacterized protein